MGILSKIFGITNSQQEKASVVNEQEQHVETHVEQLQEEPVQKPLARRFPKHPRSYVYNESYGLVDVHRLDPMFADVARYVVSKQEGSTSRLQRAFDIGYNRAGKLSDQLEAIGIVGSNRGPQGRDVLIQDLESLEQLLKQLNCGYIPSVRPKVHNNEYVAEQFLHFRNNITFTRYDSLITDVILWTIDEELVYLSDIEEEFDIDYNRAKEIVRQLIDLRIWNEGAIDSEHDVQLDDREVAQMICDYIKKNCVLETTVCDNTAEFENIKRQINYDCLNELDPQFEDVAEWIITQADFTISDIIKRFKLPTTRAVEIIDQLCYAKIINREDLDGKCVHHVLVRNPQLISMICHHVRDFVFGYIERPNIAEQPIAGTTSLDTCYVYLMHDLSNGYHKIGISKDPQYRERTLQSEKPTIEKVCAKEFPTRQIAEAIEAALHKSYAAKRLRGEWFNLDPEDVVNIKITLS